MIVRMMRMIGEIVCPGILLLGEVVMEPSKVVPYFGTVEKFDGEFAYFEQKNKFNVGDDLIAMLPDFTNVKLKVLEMYDADTNEKIIRALAVNLKVILCIGETKTERNAKKTKTVLKAQLEGALKGLYENELKNITIAYEPVWAIGTGVTPNVKDIENAVVDIKSIIAENFSPSAAEKINILYGGSVNPDNCSTLLKSKGISGFLVGGACLKPESFANIIK